MKKLLLTALTVLACGAVTALPVGNPSDASLLTDGFIWEGCCDPCPDWCDMCSCCDWCDAFSFRLGFYGDYVFNRHLELDGGNGSDIEHTEIYTNAVLLVGNWCNRVDVFATLGASNLYIDTNASAFGGIAGQRFELETDTDFSWSVGGRITLWQCGCTTLGVEGQYFSMKPDIQLVRAAASDSVYPDDTLDADYCEGQFGVGLSHRINMLVPYVAIKWSWANLKLDDAAVNLPTQNLTLFDLENKQCFGYAIGVSFVDCEKAAVTVEGRWADEKAVHVNAQIRF